MPTHVLSPEERQREQLMLRELHKFHREHAHVGGPLLTAHAKKRERVPRIDADVNPFCVERQLADEYERLNFNKNPRFYINTIRNSPRIEENRHNHSSFISDAADMMASSGFSPGARAEFTGAVPPVAYRPTEYSPPSVITIDPSELRSLPKSHLLHPEANAVRVTSKHAPPTHPHYTNQRRLQPVSFGHRPESASRMYDPLTSTVIRSEKPAAAKQLAPVGAPPLRVGMTALNLRELLTPTKSKQQQQPSPTSPLGSPAASLPTTRSMTSSPCNPIQRRRSSGEETSREELERGFHNHTFYPPKIRNEIRFLPPTDQTTAQLIDKFRKLAVGKLPGQ